MRFGSILALAALLLVAEQPDVAAQSTGKIACVGYVRSGTADTSPYRAHSLCGMRDLGYVEERNVAYEFRHYGDNVVTAQLIVNELDTERTILDVRPEVCFQGKADMAERPSNAC